MYEKILVALDGSALAEDVLPHVTGIATRTGSEVILLRVAPPVHPTAEDVVAVMPVNREEEMRRLTDEFLSYLERVADRLRSVGLKVSTAVEFGDPAGRIVDYAQENGVGLIAMSTHGRSGISRWVYGSVAGRVLRAATVPILLIRSKRTDEGLK